MTPLLEARGMTRRLVAEGVTLVRDVNLSFGHGEFVAITGPSGSGKSSLLYLLGLLDRPTEGQVLLEGQDTVGLAPPAMAALRLRHLGFVFQFHFLLPEFTALENVLIPIRKLGALEGEAARHSALALLDGLGLAPAAAKLPEQLSGGMRQRVAIARALANNPVLVLADEPTGNLDTKNAAAVFDIFERMTRAEGRTVLVVTHDPDLAARATRRVHLVDGAVVSDRQV
ncbi:ABC transporter ATP-binding protein [Roseococcus suduntuyensis]|uniref:Lipoprotein-releasing system ATP-binding protein n=1 Tax=Roseococcus suduntuyensis TaxID=455361 RepID=A0A840ABI3_9PROT|nr:ABC transporter ATP-binding protein [Roseococcus suduntuyensis]MBB3898511.1 lipoprotein-releasing system ATP-binding protein [Roseococcus suduntuyensis]